MKLLKNLVAFLLPIVVGSVIILGGFMTAFAIKHPRPETYPELTESATYYPVESLPSCFETYLGYTPQMSFDKKAGVATIHIGGGYNVEVPVKEFAKDMWAFEAPPSNANPFKKYAIFAYNCFSLEVENKFYSERGAGIFYDVQTAQDFFQEITGRNSLTLVHTMNLGNFEYYLATSDNDARVTMKRAGKEYAILGDGEFLVSARLLSQLIYDWEIANQSIGTNQISLGSII